MESLFLDLMKQTPYVGVIVFLVLKFLQYTEKLGDKVSNLLERINTENSITIREMHKETLSFVAGESNINREFLKTQREQMSLGLARLAEEIKEHKLDTLREVIALTNQIDSLLERIEKNDSKRD